MQKEKKENHFFKRSEHIYTVSMYNEAANTERHTESIAGGALIKGHRMLLKVS